MFADHHVELARINRDPRISGRIGAIDAVPVHVEAGGDDFARVDVVVH
jgi:hypothetical protein